MAKEIGNWSKQQRVARRTGDTTASLFTRHLRPDERLIWSARGRGHTGNRSAPNISDTADLGALLFAAGMLAFLPGAWATVKGVGALMILVVSLAIVAFVVPRSLFGYSLMVYGLTDRRLMIINYLLFGAVKSFAGSEIHRLLVSSYDRRGDVVFQRDDRDRWTPQSPGDPGDALVGIDDPERIAKLIQATIAPDTLVELAGRKRS